MICSMLSPESLDILRKKGGGGGGGNFWFSV